MDKKAQIGIGNLQGIILTLVILGIVLGVGFLVLGEFKENIKSDVLGNVTNETGAWINTTLYTVKNVDACNFETFAVTAARNSSSGGVILAGNYTVDSAAGTITNTTATVWTNVELDYTYYYGGAGCEGISSTIEATQKIPAWLGIIVILAIVGIVLGIVFEVMPRREGAGEIAEY